jgi:hypothetical protein
MGADRRRHALAGFRQARPDRRPASRSRSFCGDLLWNNFVFGIVLAGRGAHPGPVAVYNMISFDQLSCTAAAAGADRHCRPCYGFAQRQIVVGLTGGQWAAGF